MDMHSRAMVEPATTATTDTALALRVTELEAQLAAVTRERDQLRASHARLREELELLKRRIFVAKAEGGGTVQLEMEFAEKLRQLDALAGTLREESSDDDGDDKKDKKRRSTGRRDLRKLLLEEERIEITDPLYEDLVAQGKAKRVDFEESCKLAYKRGGMRRLVLARAKYQVIGHDGQTALDTAPMPPETFPRSLA